MKRLFLASLVIALVGCTTASPKQFYRPAGAAEQVEVFGRFDQLSFEHQVVINGDVVISDDLPYDYSNASFSGSYNDASVTSDCHWRSKSDLECLVKMNGEMAATLSF